MPLVLTALASHIWIGKRWRFAGLSLRRLATLCGIARSTAANAVNLLKEHDWITVDQAPHQRQFFPDPKLYPAPNEEWRRVSCWLFYSSTIAFLPTTAARLVYLVIIALDPVRDPHALAAQVTGDGTWADDEQAAEAILATRERHPVSVRDLMIATGLGRRAVQRSLGILQHLQSYRHTDLQPYIVSGPATRSGRWYAPRNAPTT
ncbi:MAG: hypothetical protein O7E49_00805 [Gemmatimonadetes bacterium]|nr:hypothetical protein [Gemmatimonadota bacterium]